MKKKSIAIFFLLLGASFLYSQVAINTAPVSTRPLVVSGAKNTVTTDDVIVTNTGELGVKTSTLDTREALRINGTGTAQDGSNQGFLPSRMTTVQRDAIKSPAKGLLIYNTDVSALEINNGTKDFPNWGAVGLQGPEGTFVVSKSSYTFSDDPAKGEINLGSIKVRHNGADPMYDTSDWDPWTGRTPLGVIRIASSTGKPLRVSIGGYQSITNSFRYHPQDVPDGGAFSGGSNSGFNTFFFTGDIQPGVDDAGFKDLTNYGSSQMVLNPYRGDVVVYHVTTQAGENYRITASMLNNPNMMEFNGPPNSYNKSNWNGRSPRYFIVVEKLR